MMCWRTPAFPLRKNRCTLENCGFAAVFTALKVSELEYLGRITGEEQRYGSPKYRLSGATYLATAVCQVWAMLQ
jgi:hypothetical protein